jgi:hypothetical protein
MICEWQEGKDGSPGQWHPVESAPSKPTEGDEVVNILTQGGIRNWVSIGESISNIIHMRRERRKKKEGT